MCLHPLTPRKPERFAFVLSATVGFAIAAMAFALVLTLAPPTAWLHHADRPVAANLPFILGLLGTVVSSGTSNGAIGVLAAFPDLPEKTILAVIELGIAPSLAIRLIAAGIVGGVVCVKLQAWILESTIAQPAVQHVDGLRLRAGRGALRNLKSEWARRYSDSASGIELVDGLSIPRQLETEHLLLVGGTGAGKTTILQGVLDGALKLGDRVLALDVKGDMTARWPSDEFVLLATDDKRSLRWDIGRDICTADDAMEFAMELIPETSDPSWSAGARRVLAALVQVLQAKAAARRVAWGWHHLDALLQKPVAELHALLAADHPAEASFIDVNNDATLKQAMSFYLVMIANVGQIVRVCARTGKSNRSLSIREWATGSGPNTLLLRQSQRHPQLAATIARLVLKVVADAVVSQALQEEPAPIWIVLDELPQIGRCGAVPRLAAIGRSAGVRLVAAVQSPAQLREIYGRETAQALADNFSTKIVGKVSSGSTASEISATWIGARSVRWWEETGRDANGRPRLEPRTKDIPVVDPTVLSSALGFHSNLAGRPSVYALILGHGDIARLAWPVGRWPVLRPANFNSERPGPQ